MWSNIILLQLVYVDKKSTPFYRYMGIGYEEEKSKNITALKK